MPNAEYRPHAEIDHDSEGRPLLRDVDAGFEVLFRDIGEGGGTGSSDVLYSSGHSSVEAGSTDEVHRYLVGGDEAVMLTEVQFAEQDGGTSNSDVTVTVYDNSDDSVLASADLNTRSSVSVSSSVGADIYVEVSHAGTSDVNASFTIEGSVE